MIGKQVARNRFTRMRMEKIRHVLLNMEILLKGKKSGQNTAELQETRCESF
jgi:hypothetical protein